jgi:hypothetical protein
LKVIGESRAYHKGYQVESDKCTQGVQGDIRKFGEKKTPGKTGFHQRKSRKKKKMVLQKRQMQLFKWCINGTEKQHPNLSKEEVHDVIKGVFDEVYCSSNSIVLHYRELIRNHVSTQGVGIMEMYLAKVLKVYQMFLRYTEKIQIREGD